MTENNISFSVVIPSYNRPKEIIECLNSLKEQTYSNFQVVVIDDCSEIVVSEIVDTEAYPFKLRIHRNTKNMGAAASRNAGIDLSEYEWISFLDDDDIWKKDKLEIMNKNILKNPETNFIYHNTEIKLVNENTSYIANRELPSDFFKALLVKNIVGGTSMVSVKRSLFEKYGKFDEEMTSLEDYELWLRLAKHSRPLLIEQPLTLYLYRTGRSSVSKNVESNLVSIEYINRKYSGDYEKLNGNQLSEKHEWENSMIAHKFLLNYNILPASKYYFKAFLSRFRLKFLAASIISLTYPKLLFKLR